jgi:hypothetical protein
MELRRPQGLLAVAQRLLGLGVHVDEEGVGAGRGARQGGRRDERRHAGGMARIHHHRQVGLQLHQRHRGHVQGEPGRRFERADSALAEDDLVVAGGQDVLRRRQYLVDGAAEPALEHDRQPGSAGLAEQLEVLHVAGADLEPVDHLGDALDVSGVDHLGQHGQAGPAAGLGQQVQTRPPQPLERVRRRAGLERAAAQADRALAGDEGGDRVELLGVLHRAGAGEHGDAAVADGGRADRYDGAGRPQFPAAQPETTTGARHGDRGREVARCADSGVGATVGDDDRHGAQPL